LPALQTASTGNRNANDRASVSLRRRITQTELNSIVKQSRLLFTSIKDFFATEKRSGHDKKKKRQINCKKMADKLKKDGK
jgi:hypothetical protein